MHSSLSDAVSVLPNTRDGKLKREKRYYIHEDPKEGCCARCICPDDDETTSFPRGARLTVCTGLLLVLGVIGSLIYHRGHRGNGNKAERYESKPLPFDPDLTPTYRPTPQPTVEPTQAPFRAVPTPSPTSTPAPSVENVNPPGSIANRHGWLRVDDGRDGIAQIVDEEGLPIQLRGMSLFWSNTGWEAEGFWTKEVVRILVEDWKIDVIRAAVGVEDEGGYLDDSAANWNRLTTVIDAALEFGIYVVVDWHSHNAELYQDRAEAFFTYVSAVYGRYPNLLYEVYNEPIDQDWSTVIKPYSEALTQTIRKNSDRGIVLVGTPFYSQEIDVASRDPLVGFSNIAYTFHFYAATHKASIRQKVEQALENGIAVFCSEWGTVNADAQGKVDRTSTGEWIEFMNERNIGWLNWAVSDRDESAAIIKVDTYRPYFDLAWADADLTESGLLVKSYLLDEN